MEERTGEEKICDKTVMREERSWWCQDFLLVRERTDVVVGGVDVGRQM